jgi:predicted nucleic acid-binding protein
MRALFADTFYWAALLNPRDDWHNRVRQYSNTLTQTVLVTTDEVLTEFLNFFSAYELPMREGAVQFVQNLIQKPKIRVIHQTHDTFIAGIALYANRRDKQYSLTDCISMNTMIQLDIIEVLTQDRHFKQEGFKILFGE